MRREGHDVRTAVDGEQTLAAIAERAPDLMLLDLMMPRGSGHDVSRTVRSLSNGASIGIIMLTAKGREADQREGLAAGADAYITKPFATREVVECVRGVLAQRQFPSGRGAG